MSRLDRMEEAINNLIAYTCAGLIIIFILCIIAYAIQIGVGYLVAISIGG